MSAEAGEEVQAGRCWACGYLLRGVESSQCPECGREFDRVDRRTMNFGRPMGRTGQRALRPLGGWMLLFALLGVLLIGWTTRWPVRGWHFSFLDLRFYAALERWRTQSPGMSAIDAAYTVGLLLMAAVAVSWFICLMLRLATIARYRPPRDLRGFFWRRSITLLLLMGLSIACIGIGWPYRLGQRWARQWEVESKLPNTAGFEPPLLAEAGADVPLRAVLLRGGTARERRLGMKMLVEAWMPVNFDRDRLLLDVLSHEADPENKVLALHLAGEHGGLKFEAELAARLTDPSAEIRIAAADGLGIFWGSGLLGEENEGDPAIAWMINERLLTTPDGNQHTVQSPTDRQRLQTMMLTAATLDERQAAARALVHTPTPGYRLRYAEWGVLIGEGPGKIRFTNALKDDIPPFVHPVGNPIAEYEALITNAKPAGMGKPVVHLTVDQPMAVSVEIGMNEGRPWFAYPAFDDLILLEGEFGASRQPQEQFYHPVGPMPTIRQLDPKGLPPLTNLREGYAWSSPRHRDYPWYDPTGGWSRRRDYGKLGTIRGMGMLWQSLIVTPTPLASAQLADVPKDAKYDWWRRLRQTPCSWISSRGETERFLYYDGPTIMPSPVIMKLENGQLKWTTEDYSRADDRPIHAYMRSALYVENRAGKLRGFWIDSDALTTENVENISESLAQKPAITVAQFTDRLKKHGLSEPEAQALLACWRKTFFETEGRRTLVILSRADYQALCPLNIWPVPTEQARVGIVWTEFPQ